MYTQDHDWQAVDECMREIRSLASRQRKLGELGKREMEEYLECEQQIRSINHKMNVAEVNTVQSVQEQNEFKKQKQALTIEQEAWKSLTDMRSSLKEPEKINPSFSPKKWSQDRSQPAQLSKETNRARVEVREEVQAER